ncbi:MAG: hypothetical protein QOH60_3982 [Mycobacterium sp.]|jgi:hypothetical protein|nr:hypothetical protein [Mycobacterium sp.]
MVTAGHNRAVDEQNLRTVLRFMLVTASRLLGVMLLALAPAAAATAPRAAAGEPADTRFLEVRIDRVTPETVTNTAEPTVTVDGTVTNVGDRTVRDIVVRLEGAGPVTSSIGLRTNLNGTTDQYEAVGDFINVVPELQRGQAAGFRLSYPVRASSGPSLRITRPGIYPLLVNANGTPDFGEPARLDDARFLLPVLGVPPEPPTNPQAAGDVAPDTSAPVMVTMLWPLADRPRLAPGSPGGVTPVRLTDDDLATSLAAGGRLDTLLSAAESATDPANDPGARVNEALCLAVDPDLLVTVNAMTGGYVVADRPTDRNSPTHPGAGQDAASGWLDRLRALAGRTCVTPTPYAQASLDAVRRVGDKGLATIATAGAADVVDQILRVQSQRGIALIGDERLTPAAAALLTAQGTPTVAITAADCTAQDEIDGQLRPAALVPRRVSQQLVAAPFDPTVSAALAATGNYPSTPSYLGHSLVVAYQRDSPTARRQDAIGALMWLALNPDAAPRSQVVMPPLYWDLTSADAHTVLGTLAATIRSGVAVPRSLPATVGEAQESASANSPGAEDDAGGRGRIGDQITANMSRQVGRLWGLTAALSTDPRTGLTGPQYTAPLREDMLRALSQAVGPNNRDEFAQQQMTAVDATIDDMFRGVTIVNPGGSYTLATEHSPLPLVLRNDLPVPINVRVQIEAPPGMKVTDIGVQELPPGYLPLRVPIEVQFTQRVAVDVTLRTPDGLPLGDPVRLSVHSNAYGKLLFAITITAAAVLVMLAGRRLWHRFRGQPDPADLDRPESV